MTETKTATERLREMLDALGVKWWPMYNNGYYEERDTEFVIYGKKYTAHEWGSGLTVYNLTPEQAIAATLGSGERICECGWHGFIDGWGFNPSSYCPNCGGKRVDA